MNVLAAVLNALLNRSAGLGRAPRETPSWLRHGVYKGALARRLAVSVSPCSPGDRPRKIAAFFEGSIRHQIFKAKKKPPVRRRLNPELGLCLVY